jgi:hypothetical protein
MCKYGILLPTMFHACGFLASKLSEPPDILKTAMDLYL